MSSPLFNIDQITLHLASARLDEELLGIMAEQVWLRLHERMQDISRECEHVWLVTHFPEHMLALWRRDMGDKPVQLLNPLKLDASLPAEAPDCVLVAGVLHQMSDADAFLSGLAHLMQADGALLICVPGGASYQELQHVLMQAEESVTGGVSMRMHPMLSVQSLAAMLQQANFQLPVMDAEIMQMTYGEFGTLVHELRAMGQQYALNQGRKQMLTREIVGKAEEMYRDKFTQPDGRLEVTIEWLCATVWTPHASQPKPAQRGSGVVNLRHVLGN